MFLKYLFNRATEEAEAAAGGAAAPAAPPVAATVASAKITEREADLQAQIEVLRAERDGAAGRNKKLETDIAHLQDQLARLRNPEPAKAVPADDRSELEKFMDGE